MTTTINHKECTGLHTEFVRASDAHGLKPKILYICHDHAVSWSEEVNIIDSQYETNNNREGNQQEK